MSQLNYLNLTAECRYLEKRISEAPQSAVIGRMSLESRLKKVREEVAELEKVLLRQNCVRLPMMSAVVK